MVFAGFILLAAAAADVISKSATDIHLEGINSFLVKTGSDDEWYVTARPTKMLDWAVQHSVIPDDAKEFYSLRYLDYYHHYHGTVPTGVAFGAITQAEADALGSLAQLATHSFPTTYTYSGTLKLNDAVGVAAPAVGAAFVAVGAMLL